MFHYTTIASPLTELLKKDSFQWNSTAIGAFEHLKKVLNRCLEQYLWAFVADKPST